jgi:exodeoxyribonuclease VII large subunit
MEQLAFNLAPEREIYTVSEVNSIIRGLLEETFADVWVAGEISNAKLAPSGHYYFTLKDREAQIRAVCFRQHARFLKVKPQDGLAVLARGSISVYEVRGEYQLYVEHIEPQGYGALQLAFEQLKKKLADEGLFDESRKRPLPTLPRRIGIVTSPKGAVIADMLRILERRFPGLHIQLYPTRVQGEGAAEEIAAGLDYFSESGSVDVVIIGRGGGSLEDLWAFNEEVVARAIARCEVPVISAVGHQTDFTIADFVADLRAPTPSAAAELVVRAKAELYEEIRAFQDRLVQALRYKLAITGRHLLDGRIDRATALVQRKIDGYWQRTDEINFRMRQAIERRLRAAERRLAAARHSLASRDLRVALARYRARLERLSASLAPQMRHRLERNRGRLDSLNRQLAQLSPLAILERGYSIVQTADGTVVRDAGTVLRGNRLGVRLHRGRLKVRVEEHE